MRQTPATRIVRTPALEDRILARLEDGTWLVAVPADMVQATTPMPTETLDALIAAVSEAKRRT